MSSDEDTDLSESEIDEYKDISYKKLKNEDHIVKISEVAFTCPFCPTNKKKDFLYKDLLQHAVGVGTSISKKRSSKEKANHLALAKYLKNDLADLNSSSIKPEDPPEEFDHDEKFAWPWTGIVVNIPTGLDKDGRHVGESGSKLRDQLTMRGFNPNRVHPLWSFKGHSGCAIVEFYKGWPGLHNAVSFERAYKLENHGKKDSLLVINGNARESGIYCWVARADDYNATDIIGDYLRKNRDLKSISEIMEEEARKTNKLVSKLSNAIEDKNRHIEEIHSKFADTMLSMANVMDDKDNLTQHYDDEMKKLEASEQEHYQRIVNDHEKLKLQLKSQKKELEQRSEELVKREAQNESEKKKVFEEIEKNVLRNSSLDLASLEQKKADENVFKLYEHQKAEKEVLHNKMIFLEEELNKKQALELEIEDLNGRLNVLKHMEGGAEVMEKIQGIYEVLRVKQEDLEQLEALNQTLTVMERKSNDEVQEARKELVQEFESNFPVGSNICLKRMGELDEKPFHESLKRKYPKDEAEEKAIELCSLWEEYLRDSEWHPFKMIKVEGTEDHKEIINDEDERLKGLRKDLGEGPLEAVKTSLMEINEYNPSGRYVVKELWNRVEGRKASLKEGIQACIIDGLRSRKS